MRLLHTLRKALWLHSGKSGEIKTIMWCDGLELPLKKDGGLKLEFSLSIQIALNDLFIFSIGPMRSADISTAQKQQQD